MKNVIKRLKTKKRFVLLLAAAAIILAAIGTALLPGTPANSFWDTLFTDSGDSPSHFDQYGSIEEKMGNHAEQLLMDGLKNSNPMVQWYCVYTILEYLTEDNRAEIRSRLENVKTNAEKNAARNTGEDPQTYVQHAAAFALSVVNGTFEGQGFLRSASGKKTAFVRYGEAEYNDGKIFVVDKGNPYVAYAGVNAAPVSWSPDEKLLVVATAGRTWADTFVFDIESKTTRETGVFEYLTQHAAQYDYKIGENPRSDPYIRWLEWSPDSKKVLLSYSFTDDAYQVQTGAAVFDWDQKAVDWLLKLAPFGGAHPEVKPPAGFRWDSEDYGWKSGLASSDLMDGEGVYNRKEIEKAVQQYALAINTSDTAKMRAFTNPDMPERFSDEALKTVLEDYKAYFRGKNIIRVEFAQISPYAEQTAAYRLFNDDGRYKEVSFHWDPEKGYLCQDNFLYYSEYAKQLATAFVEALSKEDAEGLASILTEDDLAYPVEKARDIIRNFKTSFDLKTIHCKFEGNMDGEGGTGDFVYLVYGEMNGVPAEHGIRVVYGDGLTGLRDELIPSIQ